MEGAAAVAMAAAGLVASSERARAQASSRFCCCYAQEAPLMARDVLCPWLQC